MYDVVIYRGELYDIGGIETWVKSLAQLYGKTHKMALVYRRGNSPSLIREVRKHIETIEYTGQTIRTKKAIFCYDFWGIKTCRAEEYYHTVHADHSVVGVDVDIPDSITEILSVSQVAKDGFKEMFGEESRVVYNPLVKPEPRRLIRLVSGTRLSAEKGLGRMKELAKALDKSGLLYEWFIFTNYEKKPFSPSVIFREPTKDLLSHIERADYLVQLSDTESYGYSIVESLSIGVPVVVTDMPVIPEIGVSDKNAIIVPLKGANYDKIAKEIGSKKFKFKYTPPADKWGEVFGKGSGNDYKYEEVKLRNIYGQDVFFDYEGVMVGDGEVFTSDNRERIDHLIKSGYAELVIQ